MQKFELGNYIILSDEGISILAKKHNIPPKSIKKNSRQVTRIEKGINNEPVVYASKSKMPNKTPIGAHLFRLASETEIRKQKIKDLFLFNDDTEKL